MGHDISGYNRAGREIAYIRFTAWDTTSHLLYEIFNASEYHAGVSGSGNSVILSKFQIENAMEAYHQLSDEYFSGFDEEFITWRRKEMLQFIKNCLDTAQKEGNVVVSFC